MSLTILEALYIVLIVFSSIIWTLLILVLVRVLKILWPIVEIAEFYEKIKKIFWIYANIPSILKEQVFWKKDKDEK